MQQTTGPISQRIAAWSGYPQDRVLGAADVARRFGVTRQRVSQIAHEDRTFPRPGFHDGHGGAAWLAAGIECWAAAHRPTVDTGQFGAEMAAVLRHAENLAERLGHGYVAAGHLWHAMASGVTGAELREALSSMGLDPTLIEEALRYIDAGSSTGKQPRRMTPRVQIRLEHADKAVRSAGRSTVAAMDVAIACIDSPRGRRYGSEDHLIWYAERRGLATPELRRRIVAAAADPAAATGFEVVPLPKRRPPRLRRRRPAWLDLAPNPLGHDPWLRQGWGSVFAITRDGRHLEADGKHWFFYLDADGYFVRAADGRPVGYRWWLVGKGEKAKPRGGKLEILPMPPVPVDDWPDRRYMPED